MKRTIITLAAGALLLLAAQPATEAYQAHQAKQAILQEQSLKVSAARSEWLSFEVKGTGSKGALKSIQLMNKFKAEQQKYREMKSL